MAQKTLTTLLTEVQDYIPGIIMAKVGRSANVVLQRIAKEMAETGRTTFTTRAQTTTGTVAVTTNTSGVTFSSPVLAPTDPVMLVKILGCDEWFTLTYVSTTTGTLSSAWPAATNGTATFTISYPCITFGSDVLQPNKIWQHFFNPLERVSAGQDHLLASDPGRPEGYSFFSANTGATPNDAYRIFLHPAPDLKYTFNVAYKKRPAQYTVSDGTSMPAIPDIWDAVLLYGTMFHCYLMDSKSEEANYWKALYEEAFMHARGHVMSEATSRFGEDGDDGTYVFESRPVGG